MDGAISEMSLYAEKEYRERTFNGQSRVVVNRDGKDIIVF